MTGRRPELDTDLYTDAAIADPYPIYRTIRDLGPAVWLSAHGVWAIARFADVRAALRADAVLVSGRGVAMNDVVNSSASRVTLTSDGADHRRLRKALMAPMMPSTLTEVEAEIRGLADELVDRLVARDSFDGIVDFAQVLPLSVVARLVGLPDAGRQRMLEWAGAMFDALGVMNERGERALPFVLELAEYVAGLDRSQLRPEGWAARLYAAVEEGRIEARDVAGMLIDYVAPSLDTTILGTGHLLFELGRHPEQWELVRKDRVLVPRAVHEALRLESPVRAFTRLAVEDYSVDGTVIPAGDRVLVLYAAANRDERRYPGPDRFDVTRDAKDHLGFGHGVHRCAGSHLAELEMQSLLHAMAARVRRIEIGNSQIVLNNVLRGYRGFRASFA
ncbi:MAG TPA: cytochrome P450 [Candidatus Binatia bacterium]|nr:cytochrome P450 [Candidatus Binatia bacterium]